MMNRDNVNPTTYNKLFVIGAKEYTEEDFQQYFSKYGTVTKVWKVKNKEDGTDRGLIFY